MKIIVNAHSSVKFVGDKVIYFDPYKILETTNDADIVFITHDHYDHLSSEDLQKVINENTLVILPESCLLTWENLGYNNEIYTVKPDNHYHNELVSFDTVGAYNINKNFHPKNNNWVGYIVNIDGKRYYVAGDTDMNDDNVRVKCDVALIPIGGTYTMDYKEAAEFVNIIKPSMVIPIHYGSIVGSKEDALRFKELLLPEITCNIFIR